MSPDQDREIPEYWIIEQPQQSTVLVLTLVGDRYTEFGDFQGNATIQSPQFGTLPFTPAEMFTAAN